MNKVTTDNALPNTFARLPVGKTVHLPRVTCLGALSMRFSELVHLCHDAGDQRFVLARANLQYTPDLLV